MGGGTQVEGRVYEWLVDSSIIAKHGGGQCAWTVYVILRFAGSSMLGSYTFFSQTIFQLKGSGL